MTKINEVSKGEGDWQRPINSLIKLANSQVGGGTVQHLANPASFLNGASAKSIEIYYVDRDDGYRWVYLCIDCLKVTDFVMAGMNYAFQLPDGFEPLAHECIAVSQSAVVVAAESNHNCFEIYDSRYAQNDHINEDYLSGGKIYLAKIQ